MNDAAPITLVGSMGYLQIPTSLERDENAGLL